MFRDQMAWPPHRAVIKADCWSHADAWDMAVKYQHWKLHQSTMTHVPVGWPAGGQLFPHDDVSNCWFVEQEADNVAKWSDYLFMTSIQFLVQREMEEIAPRWGSSMRLSKRTAPVKSALCKMCDVRRTA
jgi:hypothetical protein